MQRRLSRRLHPGPLPADINVVAGADMALSRRDGVFFAAVTVLTFPDLEVVEVKGACVKASRSYIPGMLSFREGPALLAAFEKIENRPDVVLFDGQGIAHPRRLGLAAHMGLWLQMPSVGCAKSRLTGEYIEPGREKGDREFLVDGGRVLGVVLRTRRNVKPLFVSPGHHCDVDGAAELTLKCCTRYRMPEPTRMAHREVGAMKRRFADNVHVQYLKLHPAGTGRGGMSCRNEPGAT